MISHCDNLYLLISPVNTSYTGIHRADRLTWSFFELKNHRKSIIRLGQEDHGTCHEEILVVLNSYAREVGYDNDKLPFKDLSVPTADNTVKEYMGFMYCLPCSIDRVTNPTDLSAAAVSNSGDT